MTPRERLDRRIDRCDCGAWRWDRECRICSEKWSQNGNSDNFDHRNEVKSAPNPHDQAFVLGR
jgi:hypothetical protein